MIFLSSLEMTFSVGTRSRSDSESAKLSPIQLNSGLLDVFSKGRTRTVSVPCANAEAAKTAVIRIMYKYFLNIIYQTKNSLIDKRIGQSSDAKNVRKDGNRYGI